MKIDYENVYTHFVFCTMNRHPFITIEVSRLRIEKYITGIGASCSSRLYAIYANPDHMHLLISRWSGISEQELATRIADASTKFINENQLCAERFTWQQSASAFSVSKSHVDRVCKYILNQPNHHKKVTFKEEYDLLQRYYQHTLHVQRKPDRIRLLDNVYGLPDKVIRLNTYFDFYYERNKVRRGNSGRKPYSIGKLNPAPNLHFYPPNATNCSKPVHKSAVASDKICNNPRYPHVRGTHQNNIFLPELRRAVGQVGGQMLVLQ